MNRQSRMGKSSKPTPLPSLLLTWIVLIWFSLVALTKQGRINRQKSLDNGWLLSDPSCNTTYEDQRKNLDNIWEFDNNTEAMELADLYEKDYRFPSYVDYPCNVNLYEKYKREFLDKFMECPFKQDLNKKFRKFVKQELWALKQANSPPDKVEASSLLYQYICFSKQHLFEECVPDQDRLNLSGACTGVCRCMDKVPLKPEHLPKGLDRVKQFPQIVKELDVRCGVKSGGACWRTWSTTCNWESDEDLLQKYSGKDLQFKCETMAKCHRETKLCECARGHSCQGSSAKSGAEGGRANTAWIVVVGRLLVSLVQKIIP